jgi:hypothetical protein
MSRFSASGLLGYFGILGGVAIALGLPWIVLAHGASLSEGARLTVVILSLLIGGLLAVASAVVGIAIPTTLREGRLDIGGIIKECCPPGECRASDDSKVPGD